MTQAARGAAFQKALAVKCQGCLSRRFPPCLFLPYRPHRKTESEQKNKPEGRPSWLCHRKASGAELSPRGAAALRLEALPFVAWGEARPPRWGGALKDKWPRSEKMLAW